MKLQPKVSVCMITYGHEKFIEQAIHGVLMQKGDFEIELIIANDCSPDNTDAVIHRILKDHPNASWINYFKHEKNLGIMSNFYFALEQCNGDFIAMCEGDDYWIDEFKIQKQLEVFKKNNEINLVYTNVRFLIQNSGAFIDNPLRFTTREFQVKEMLESKYVEFATTLFKKFFLIEIAVSLKEEMMNKVIGDTRIFLEAAHRSELGYVDEVTTVYRINEGSASNPTDISKFIFTSLDSYFCRKSFVLKYGYPKVYLSKSLINTFKSFVRKAYSEKNYLNSLKILYNIPYLDLVRFVRYKNLLERDTLKYFAKFFLTLIGIKNVS